MAKKSGENSQSRYKALVEKVFFDRYKSGERRIEFEREDLITAAGELNIRLPKNIGDVVYSIRYRTPMPDGILKIQQKGLEWIIEGAGRSKYVFKLVRTYFPQKKIWTFLDFSSCNNRKNKGIIFSTNH